MSLWTPYAESVPLDLTKTNVKEEQEYTRVEYQDYSPVPETQYPQYIAYPQPTYAPIGRVSPMSGGSLSSHDSIGRYGQTVYQSSLTHGDLSPPASPTHEQAPKRSHTMIEADYLSDDPDFQAFERDALRAMAEKNGGTLLGNNPRMRRTVQSKNETADEAYRRQRERNNYAAKQSRDRRKLREIHLSLKVAYLRKEIAGLKSALYSRACARCQQSCLC